jgi:hypothetical protein
VTKHQLRLLLCAGSSLALMIVSMFVVEWFRISIEGLDLMGMSGFKLDLRSASACMPDGSCASVPLSKFQGFYPTISVATFYGSCVTLLIVAFQAGSRLLGGTAGEGITRLGYLFAIGGFLAAGATGYLFQPETAAGNLGAMGMVSVTVTRTWGPAMLLLADVLALVTLHLASAEDSFDSLATSDAKRLPVTPVRVRPPTAPPMPYKPASRASVIPFESIPIDGRKPSAPAIDRRLSANDAPIEAAPAKPRAVSSIPLDERLSANEAPPDSSATAPDAGPAIARTTSSADTAPDAIARAMSSIPLDARSLDSDFELPLPPVKRSTASPFMTASDLPSAPQAPAKPEASVRGKLSFATTTVALTSNGVDATCETGATKAVAWSDVVGVVARRLPPDAPYHGETFVDLVSTSGSTLRILPWTELTGELLQGSEGPIERARAFVQLVASRCPGAKLDAATRTFLGSRGLAAQLPDAALLAQHDARLS